MHVRRLPELPDSDRRLGRHVVHDPRSRRYPAPAGDVATLTSVRHERHIPVLQQGALGSCTGHAAEACLGAGGFLASIPQTVKARPTADADVDHEQAVALYSAATSVDEFPGAWPPDDTGSSGLGVAKACKQAGLISGYRHAFGLEAALTALAVQPVIAGIGWYSSFDEPDRTGLIRIGRDAFVRGGHEICFDELDVERRRVGFTNSWGTGWGRDGRAYIGWDDFARLLSEDGDVTVFVPLSEPAPQPDPEPEPDVAECVVEFFGLLRRTFREGLDWLDRHGF